MNRLPLLLVLLLLVPVWQSAARDLRSQKALDALDEALTHREEYIGLRQGRIDSLITILSENKSRARVLMEVADEYTGFNNDSALVYLDRGRSISQGRERYPFMWKHAALLPLAGFFEAAFREYESIPADSLPQEWLASYYDAGRQMYSYVAAFFAKYPEVARDNHDKALRLQQDMLDVLSHDTIAYSFNLGEYNFLLNNRAKAEVLLEDVVRRVPAESNVRARAAHHLSTIARENGDDDAYLYYLAQSAEADVRAATREVVSLQELGNRIYQQGDVTRAHRYLSTALQNAVECGAPLRTIDTSNSLPIIERAHSDHIAEWRHGMYWIISGLAVLMIVLIAMMLFLRHEMHRMRILQSNLKAANHAKEVYISQFLQLCSIYMDKLTQFCKIATRKLAAGQSEELYRMTKSGKFVEEQSKEFYEVFDSAFLHIYPDFVSEVNKLFRADAQIELRAGELLNTDLRILAFMRLGIEESARIAQVLNYSLNTIYAYRNRLKSRAINKETFEADVMKISQIS